MLSQFDYANLKKPLTQESLDVFLHSFEWTMNIMKTGNKSWCGEHHKIPMSVVVIEKVVAEKNKTGKFDFFDTARIEVDLGEGKFCVKSFVKKEYFTFDDFLDQVSLALDALKKAIEDKVIR